MKHTVDTAFYPGWTRKAVTFSIDDGNIPMDRKFLSYVKPAGILGSFNLCSERLNALPKEEYLAFYSGYGITNHGKRHPMAIPDDVTPDKRKDEPFDEKTADPTCIYPTGEPLFFWYHAANGWRVATENDNYIRLCSEGLSELNEFFGEDTVTEFVWPYRVQPNEVVKAAIFSAGYESIRKTGNVKDSTGFAVPEDRMNWSYNATQFDLSEVGAQFMGYPDDGELKFFCVGVHSIDYENAGKWDLIAEFCERFGNKPAEYYSAPVRDLFRYADATKKVTVTEEGVENPTDIDLYIKVDGKRKTLRHHSFIPFD